MGLQHCGTVPLCGMVTHTSVVKNQFLMVRFFRCTISAIAAKEGQKKSGQEFASGRENPNHKLDTKNLYPYRKQKALCSRRVIRKSRYKIQPHDIIIFQGRSMELSGCHNKGTRVMTEKSLAL